MRCDSDGVFLLVSRKIMFSKRLIGKFSEKSLSIKCDAGVFS
jgi:hypothetical protein